MRTAIVAVGFAVLLAGCERAAGPAAEKKYHVWIFAYGTDCKVETGASRLSVPADAEVTWQLSAGSGTANCDGDTLMVGQFEKGGVPCDIVSADQPGSDSKKKIKKAKKDPNGNNHCKYTVKVGNKGIEDPELEIY